MAKFRYIVQYIVTKASDTLADTVWLLETLTFWFIFCNFMQFSRKQKIYIRTLIDTFVGVGAFAPPPPAPPI